MLLALRRIPLVVTTVVRQQRRQRTRPADLRGGRRRKVDQMATVTVHWPNGFSSIKLLDVDAAGAHFGQPGYEADFLYLAALVALVIGGSGPLALDTSLLSGKIGDCSPDRVAPSKSGRRPFPTAASHGSEKAAG
jgi:hypothetical protein